MFDPATAPHLKPWLVRALEPICDAEPGALSDYILALLKHNVPETEMRKELSSQLEEFLEKEGPPFIDALFNVLRTKSYLPYTTSATAADPSTQHNSTSTGIPIPLDALLSPSWPSSQTQGVKRSFDIDDSDQRPAKGPRLRGDGNFSRNGGDSQSMGVWRGPNPRRGWHDAYGSGDGNVPDGRRVLCRDYHNKGYCARGSLCRYSHGEDAVIPSQLMAMNGPSLAGPGLPFMPFFPGPLPMLGLGGAYDPHESRLEMGPPSAIIGSGDVPPHMAPIAPRLGHDNDTVPPHSDEMSLTQQLGPGHPSEGAATDTLSSLNHSQPHGQSFNTTADVEMGSVMQDSRNPTSGSTSLPDTKRRPDRSSEKTLVVEKIPEDKLKHEAISEWFKRFGTVTHVAIDVRSAKALVSFSEHSEAHAAWRSEDAVFNNRFVKLFWHRPMAGHGQTGARMLAASAPLLVNIARKETSTTSEGPKEAATTGHPPKPTKTPADIAAKKQLLEHRIAEQKSLMASLEKSSPEEKKEILARARMKLAAASTPSGHEQKADSSSDKELATHSADDGSVKETNEDLKAKLAKLKVEAARLGLPEAVAQPARGSTFRPYRARGRGGRFSYGAVRGGRSRASMKLDNRPKTLLVTGVQEDKMDVLGGWYGISGQMESVKPVEGGAAVTFKTRVAAEQALAKGPHIPSLGQVTVTWLVENPASQSDASVSMPSGLDHDHLSTNDHEPTDKLEDESTATGWGGEYDDNDGMGML